MARNNSGVKDIRANALDKASESSKMAKIYSTAKINLILEDIKKGKKPDLDPFFHGKKEYRDCGITFERTEEEDEEYRKCAMDCIYFVEKYVKFKNDKGYTLVKLRDYQKEILHLMSDEVWDEELLDVKLKNSRVLLLQSRLTGKCYCADTNITIDNDGLLYDILKTKYSIINYFKNKIKNLYKYVISLIFRQ